MLNDWGGGNVDWWHDYLRYELGRANEYWADQAIELSATIERLREYAGHRMWCNVMSKDYDREQEGCDCGYDALMAEVGESK